MTQNLITVAGFGKITAKQALGEVAYFAAYMQAAYKEGRLNIAIQAMRSMTPFIDALRASGYTIEQILPR